MTSTPRFAPFKLLPDVTKAMMAVETALGESGIEIGLAELVRLRASQINGCAFCIYMHVQDAKKHGETDLRLQLLDAWRESPLYTERERAALAWTESLTRVAKTHASDADYNLVKSQFNETEIAALTALVSMINAWNRLQIGAGATHPAPAAPAA
ncbi:MAG: carboxymuconolactone decarboxylase family protein [Caulobacter sp.]|nr:carboxymuconolactone decarboxylase family protein [Caulobacter sp.]